MHAGSRRCCIAEPTVCHFGMRAVLRSVSVGADVHSTGGREAAGRIGTVAAVPHDPALLAAFNADADTRMVWATERADRSRVVYLEDGTAREMRARTKSELACIVPECDLRLTTHARSTKRDGFAHLGRVDDALHSAESLMHQQAKAVIVSWLRSKYPGVMVDPEVLLVNGERRPDVYAENPQTGNRLAFEVQYSALTVREWERRHEWYADHGIVDVWVFGHVGSQRGRARSPEFDVATNALQQHLLAQRELLWWIEPISGIIATPYEFVFDDLLARDYKAPPRVGARDLLFDLSVLADAWLTARGFRTRALLEIDELASRRAVDRAHAWRESEKEAAIRREQDRVERLAAAAAQAEAVRVAQERAAAAESARAAAEAAERRRAELEEQLWRAALQRVVASAESISAAFAASDVVGQVGAVLGTRPHWLYVNYSDQVPETALGIAHHHWQAAAFLHVLRLSLHDREGRARRPVTTADFEEGVLLTGLQVERRLLERLVVDWCGHLWEQRQLSDRDAQGRARLLTRISPERRALLGPLAAAAAPTDSAAIKR